MTRILASLAEIGDLYDTLFCDLWGCVHNGIVAYPEAVAALQAYRAKGGRVALITNAPRPYPAVLAAFPRYGIPDDAWDVIVTSGDASRRVMIEGQLGPKVHHIGPAKDESFFTDTYDGLDPSGITRVPLEEATGIVCTDLNHEDTETPEDYRERLAYAAAKGLPMLCTNPDLMVDIGERRVWCGGALAKMYREDFGGTAILCGKPHAPIYELARAEITAKTGRAPERGLCIGDGVLTDVKGGIDEGMDQLFITGGLAAGEFGASVEEINPELLAPWLERHGVSATYALPFLR